MKFYVFGSSHITRFNRLMCHNNISWSLQNHYVKLHGISGGTVSSLFQNLSQIYIDKPDMIFLQLGSNDISHADVDLNGVLLSFEIAIQSLLNLGVKMVFIGRVFYRNRVARWRGLTLDQYNARVGEINVGFRQLEQMYRGQVVFWRHRGFQLPSIHILLPEGVHLNLEGNKRLYLSLRGSFLFAEKILMYHNM